MRTVSQFRAAFVAALKQDPPVLKDNILDYDTFGEWLIRHFNVDDVEILKHFEAIVGEDQADEVLLSAFEEAGLPRPIRKRRA